MVEFDLGKLKPPACNRGGTDIVVCGHVPDERLPALAPLPEPAMPKAQIEIGGITAGIEGESTKVGGFPSNRLMMRLKKKF